METGPQDSPCSLSQRLWPKHLSPARPWREEQRLSEDPRLKLSSCRKEAWSADVQQLGRWASRASRWARGPSICTASSERANTNHPASVSVLMEDGTESGKPQTVCPPFWGPASISWRCRRDRKPCPHNGGRGQSLPGKGKGCLENENIKLH